MRYEEFHISDRNLLLSVDGEISKRRMAKIREHLAACWTCRARMKKLENTVTDFVTICHQNLDLQLPASTGPRALLKAQLARLAEESYPDPRPQFVRFLFSTRLIPVGAIAVLLVLGLAIFQLGRLPSGLEFGKLSAEPVFSPDPRKTPGMTSALTQWQVCRQETAEVRSIPASMGKEVFEKYGIVAPPPRAYELDFLISPELGGAEDVRNLWPQPYSGSVWNAHVKDALEDYLRHLVCTQRISLARAQQDLATDWIAAYKKYFRQDAPSPDHLAFLKDRPWE